MDLESDTMSQAMREVLSQPTLTKLASHGGVDGTRAHARLDAVKTQLLCCTQFCIHVQYAGGLFAKCHGPGTIAHIALVVDTEVDDDDLASPDDLAGSDSMRQCPTSSRSHDGRETGTLGARLAHFVFQQSCHVVLGHPDLQLVNHRVERLVRDMARSTHLVQLMCILDDAHAFDHILGRDHGHRRERGTHLLRLHKGNALFLEPEPMSMTCDKQVCNRPAEAVSYTHLTLTTKRIV